MASCSEWLCYLWQREGQARIHLLTATAKPEASQGGRGWARVGPSHHYPAFQEGLKPPQPIPLFLPFPLGKWVASLWWAEGCSVPKGTDGCTEGKRHPVGAHAVVVQMLGLVQQVQGWKSCLRPKELLPDQQVTSGVQQFVHSSLTPSQGEKKGISTLRTVFACLSSQKKNNSKDIYFIKQGGISNSGRENSLKLFQSCCLDVSHVFFWMVTLATAEGQHWPGKPLVLKDSRWGMDSLKCWWELLF